MLHRLWRSDGSGETLDKFVYIWSEYEKTAVRETALKNLLCIFILLQKKKKKKVRKVPAEVTRERCPATAPPPGMASIVCTYEGTYEHTVFSNLNLKAVKVPLLCSKRLLCFPLKRPPLWNLLVLTLRSCGAFTHRSESLTAEAAMLENGLTQMSWHKALGK